MMPQRALAAVATVKELATCLVAQQDAAHGSTGGGLTLEGQGMQ